MTTLSKNELLRYSRQMALPQIGLKGQERLQQAKVMIIGLGGLGSPASIYLAAAGVGELILVDHDHVELSNLQRQIVHSTAHIGEQKVISAKKHLEALNPEINIKTVEYAFPSEALRAQMQEVDIVVDASDNFSTRFQINTACLVTKTPLVSAGAIRHEAQISLYDANKPDSPCYQCIYEEQPQNIASCRTAGVIPPLLGLAGSMQALETIKYLVNYGESLLGKLLIIDLMSIEFHIAKVNKNPVCQACGNS